LPFSQSFIEAVVSRMIATSRFPVRPPLDPLAAADEDEVIVLVPKPKKVLTVAVCVTVTTLAPVPGQVVAAVGPPGRRLHTQAVEADAETD
jgi:hypothetical protein